MVKDFDIKIRQVEIFLEIENGYLSLLFSLKFYKCSIASVRNIKSHNHSANFNSGCSIFVKSNKRRSTNRFKTSQVNSHPTIEI